MKHLIITLGLIFWLHAFPCQGSEFNYFLHHLKSVAGQQPAVEAANLAKEEAKKASQAISRLRFPTLSFKINAHYYDKEEGEGVSGNAFEIIPGITIPAGFLASSNQSYFQTNFNLTLKQSLWDNGSIFAQMAEKEVSLRSATQHLAQTEQDLLHQGTTQLIALWQKILTLSGLSEKKSLLQAKFRLMKRQVTMGKQPPLKIEEAQFELNAVEEEIKNETEAINQKKRFLITQLHFFPEALEEFPLFLRESKLAPPKQSLLEILMYSENHHPTLLALNEQIAAIKIQQEMIKSQTKQQTILYSSLDYLQNDAVFTKSWEKMDRIWIAGIQMDWPFWDSRKTTIELSALKTKLEALQQTKQDQSIQIKIELENHWETLQEKERAWARLHQQIAWQKKKFSILAKFKQKNWVTWLEQKEGEYQWHESKRAAFRSALELLKIKIALAQLSGLPPGSI